MKYRALWEFIKLLEGFLEEWFRAKISKDESRLPGRIYDLLENFLCKSHWFLKAFLSVVCYIGVTLAVLPVMRKELTDC